MKRKRKITLRELTVEPIRQLSSIFSQMESSIETLLKVYYKGDQEIYSPFLEFMKNIEELPAS